jgi:signal transduction histidine kinase
VADHSLTRPAQLRFFLLALALVLLAALTAVAAWIAAREFGTVRRQFEKVQMESFRIADELISSVARLNSSLFAYEASGEDLDRQNFERDSRSLGGWLAAQSRRLHTPEERQLLEQINKEYTEYLAEGRKLIATRKPDESDAESSRRLARVEAVSKTVMKLGGRLANAHRAALGQLVSSFERSLNLLKTVITGALLLLVVFGALGLRALYRELIAPLRKQLVESRALLDRQEKLASLGVLAAGVAHEIRNPLTAIKARLFTQRKLLEKGSSAMNDADLISNEITRLERIVRDFLHFASPSDPSWSAISVRALLGDLRELLAPELEKKEIALEVAAGEDFTLRADAQQLKQVLINLVQNAAESIGERGRVTLRTYADRVPLGGQVKPAVIIEISDTGSGIPLEVQKRLFDPFYTTKSTGTGLGLSIAMRIMEKHRGTLQFQTEPGKGTTFGLVLPRDANPLAIPPVISDQS